MAKFNESEKAIQSLNDELEKLRKQTKAVADENIRLNDTIKKQSTSVDDLKNKDKQLTTAEKELEKLDKQLLVTSAKLNEKFREKNLVLLKAKEALRQQNEEQKKALGIQNRFVGGIKSGITQFGLWLGAITGVTVVLKKFLTGVKDSSQFMSDQWTVTIAQGKTALETFYKALSSPNGFRNFFSNLKESLSEVRKYVKELDELGELNRELRIQEQKARQSLAEQAKIFRSSTTSIDEKREATEKYIQIQRDLADTKEKLTKRAYENEISNLIKGTELTREQAKAYIENYSALDPLVKKAIDFLETQRDLQPVAFTLNPIKGWSNAISGAMNLISGETSKEAERLKELAKSFDNTGKAGEDAFKQAAGYLSFSEEAMNKTGAAAEAYFGSLGQFDEKTLRAQLAQDRVNATTKKGVQETTKALNDMSEEAKALAEMNDAEAESDKEDFEFAMQYAKDLSDAKKKEDEEYLAFKQDMAVQLDETEKEIAENALKLYEETIEKKKKAEQDLADAKKELAEETEAAAKKIATDYFNAGIDERLNAFQEAQDIEETKLKNKLDKGVITEAEYERQIKALKLKTRQEEAKAEKKKAIFDIAINTLVAVVKALPNIPLAVTVGAIGLASGIAVAAKPEPKFRHGTKGPLKEGVVGTFSEDGPEYFRNKKLGIEGLTPKFETKAFIPEGTEIFPVYSKETKEAKERVSNDGTITELREIKKAVLSKNNVPVWTRSGLVSFNEATQRRIISRRRLINGD